MASDDVTNWQVRRVTAENSAHVAQATKVEQVVFGTAATQGMPSSRTEPWSAELTGDSRSILLVGTKGEKIIGFCHGRASDDDVFEVRRAGVLPNHRRQGIGGALLARLEEEAGQCGFRRLRCAVPNQAKDAMRICIFYGMRIVGLDRSECGVRVIFEKRIGTPPLIRPSRRSISFSVEGWPIKRACELEGIYADVFGGELEEGHPTLDEMLMLDATYEDVLHVAVSNGRPIGFKHAQERTRGVLHSHLGAVLPEYRGGGVAGALLKAQHLWAAGEGYAAVTTRSRNRYPHMMRLNLKAGFDVVGVVEAMGELSIHLFKRLK